jgi:serine/threonine protein kinase
VRRLLAFSTDGACRCLVLELCSGGALDGRLERGHPRPLAWPLRLRIALDIASALVHLHKARVLHR